MFIDSDFRVTAQDIHFVGHDLNKPTCIQSAGPNLLRVTDTQLGLIEINLQTHEQRPLWKEGVHHAGEQINAFITDASGATIGLNMTAQQVISVACGGA